MSVQTHEHWTWQPFSSLQQQQQSGPARLHCPISVTAGAAAAIAAQAPPCLHRRRFTAA